MKLLLLVGCIFAVIPLINALEVCLFASCGCRSHDVMMKNVGDYFSDANISWVQTYVFEFGFGPLELPPQWNDVRIFEFDADGQELMKKGGSLIWEMNVPLDIYRAWDLRAFTSYIDILSRNQQYCIKLLHSEKFQKLQQQKKFDLVVVDYIVQACTTVMASLLNATTVQYSNWPICDGYLSSFNVPSNPSSVAQTLSPFSGNRMNFVERFLNTIVSMLLFFLKTFEGWYTSKLYQWNGIFNVDFTEIEAKQILYGARSGLLFEHIRPLTNRIKYFGCPTCGDMKDYKIASPKTRRVMPKWNCFYNQHLPTFHQFSNISTERLRPYLVNQCQSAEIEKRDAAEVRRFLDLQHQFPKIDFYKLEEHKFALISFGSLAQVEHMPGVLLDKFLNTLGKLSYTVVWQTNSEEKKFLGNRTIPPNVILTQWAPLKILLAHRNLLYFISHGGINTVNELLYFGVPIIGVPLQGDQVSNIQRLVDLGMGKAQRIGNLWSEGLANSIKHMEDNLRKYSRRAKQISGMAIDQRRHYLHTEEFWLRWAARHGNALLKPGRKFLDLFYRSSFEYFAVPQLSVALILILSLASVVY